jgi:hypothetical protein
MAVVFKRTDIAAFFEKGDTPSQAHFMALVAAFPMVYNETVSLAANVDLEITHGIGENARIVQVTDSNGVSVGVNWRRDSSDPTNKVIINSGKSYSSAEVTILTK